MPPATFKALERNRLMISLDDKPASAKHRCLPWGSAVMVRAGEQEMRIVTGPASWQHGQWLLPVFWFFFDPDADLAEIEREALKVRRSWGWRPARRVNRHSGERT